MDPLAFSIGLLAGWVTAVVFFACVARAYNKQANAAGANRWAKTDPFSRLMSESVRGGQPVTITINPGPLENGRPDLRDEVPFPPKHGRGLLLMADRKELLAVIREALQPGVFGNAGANWDPILCNPEHPCHHDLVRLCEQIGYGAVMSATSYLWKQKHGGSAKTVGTCYTTHENWLRRAKAAVGRKADSAGGCGLMCDCVEPTVFEETVRIARKVHWCVECRRYRIEKGIRYREVRGLWDGDWETFRRCPRCERVAAALGRWGRKAYGSDYCIGFGEMRQELRQRTYDRHRWAKDWAASPFNKPAVAAGGAG